MHINRFAFAAFLLNAPTTLKSVDGASSPPKPAVKRPLSPPSSNADTENSIEAARRAIEHSPMLNDNNEIDSDDSNEDKIEGLKKKVDEIFEGVGNVKVIDRMKELLDENPTEVIRKAVKGYLIGLLSASDDELLSECKKHQIKLTKIINNMKKKTVRGQHVYWMANFGEFLNALTEGLLLANYAPDDDCTTHDHQHPDYNREDDNTVPTNCIPRTNPCMLVFIRTLINSLIKESDNLNTTIDDNSTHFGVRLVDACCVVLGKDNYQREIKDFIKQAKLKDLSEFYMISLVTIGYHARIQKCNKNAPLPLLPATANGRDNMLDDNIKYNDAGVYDANPYFRVFEYVAHGECWACKYYLLQFDEDVLKRFGCSLVGFYSSFDNLKALTGLVSEIALRFSGLLSMTAEEKAALVLNRLFFYKSQTVAKALAEVEWVPSSLQGTAKDLWRRLLGNDYGEKEEEDMLARLKHVHDNMHWGTLASALFSGDVPKSRTSLGSDMRDLYGRLLSGMDGKKFMKKVKREAKDNGGAGKWGTLAAALSGVVEVDRSTLSGETAALYDELLESYFLEKLKNVYEAQVTSGNWSVLASALHNTTPPWSRDSLPTDALIAIYDKLSTSFSGSNDAFLQKLKDIYEALVEGGRDGGTKAFNNRLGYFKWMDDFDSLFLRILESGLHEGGEMMTDDEKEKFKTFGHVLEVAPIISQINISNLTQQQISGIVTDIVDGQQYDQAMSFVEEHSTNAEEKYDEIDVVLKTGIDDKNGGGERWTSLFNRLGQSSDVGVMLRLVYGIKKYRNTQSFLDDIGVQKNIASLGKTKDGDY